MSTARTIAKNTSVLIISMITTTVTGIIFTALLSRHVGPEGIGKYAIANSIVAMLMIVVNLGFHELTIRAVAQSKAQASKYLSNITVLKVFLAVIVFVGFFVIASMANYSKETILLVILIGINLVLDAVIQVTGSIFFAFEKMEYQVLTQIVRSLLALGLGAAAIYLGYNLAEILAIVIFANVIKAILSFKLLSNKVIKVTSGADFSFSKSLIVASLPFALLRVAAVIFSNVNVLMLGALVSEATVGFFASALRVVTMLHQAPEAFLAAIYPVLSRFFVSSEESLAASFSGSYKVGLMIQFPMAAGVFLIADQVINLINGPGFEPAGDALRILSLVVGVSFTNYVCGGTLNAIGKERLFATISWIEIPIIVVINWFLIPKFGFVGPALTYAISNWLEFALYSVLCHHWLKLRLPWFLGFRVLIATLLMALSVHFLLQSGIHFILNAFLLGPVIYVGALFVLRVFSTDEIILFRQALKRTG